MALVFRAGAVARGAGTDDLSRGCCGWLAGSHGASGWSAVSLAVSALIAGVVSAFCVHALSSFGRG